jgi:hypothetical protein
MSACIGSGPCTLASMRERIDIVLVYPCERAEKARYDM